MKVAICAALSPVDRQYVDIGEAGIEIQPLTDKYSIVNEWRDKQELIFLVSLTSVSRLWSLSSPHLTASSSPPASHPALQDDLHSCCERTPYGLQLLTGVCAHPMREDVKEKIFSPSHWKMRVW